MLALLGFTLLLWALFWDRSKGRRRCPRCWYNLSGTPQSLTCSECGRTAKGERRFRKTRRRWGWGALAFMLTLIGSLGVWGGDFSRRGWQAMPTTGLVLAIPWLRDHSVVSTWRVGATQELENRLAKRIESGAESINDLWDWQRRLIVREAFLQVESAPRLMFVSALRSSVWGQLLQSELLHGQVHAMNLVDRFCAIQPIEVETKCTEEWPVGLELPVTCQVKSPYASISDLTFRWPDGRPIASYSRSANNFQHSNEITRLIDLPEGVHSIRASLHLLTNPGQIDSSLPSLPLPSREITLNVRVRRTLESHLQANGSSVIEEIIQHGFGWILQRDGSGFRLLLALDDKCMRYLNEIGACARVLICHRGEVVAKMQGVFDYEFPTKPTPDRMTCFIPLPASLESFARGDSPDDGLWSLQFMMDWARILSNERHRTPSQSYWLGIIDQPFQWNEKLNSSELAD